MRTLQSFSIVAVIVAAAAALLPGCSSSDSTPTGGEAGSAGAHATGTAGAGTAGAGTAGAATGTAGAGTAGAANIPGDAANGQTLFTSMSIGCNACHGDGAEGGIGPNISGSAAGIGTWTQAQFYNAVRNATARSGAPLCSLMQKFPVSTLSDQGVYDIYAFVMSKMVAAPAANPSCHTQ